MFIPLDLNLPLLVGGLIQWYVTSRTNDKGINEARGELGTLIASGFIAGGALMGVISAAIRFFGVNWMMTHWVASSGAEWASLGAYLMLIGFFIWMVVAPKKGSNVR